MTSEKFHLKFSSVKDRWKLRGNSNFYLIIPFYKIPGVVRNCLFKMLMACRLLKEQKQKTKSEEIVASLVNYPGLISYKFNLIFFEYHLLLSKGQLKCFVSKFDFIQTFLIKLYKQDKSLSRFFSLIFFF